MCFNTFPERNEVVTQSRSYIHGMFPTAKRRALPPPRIGSFSRSSLFCLSLGFLTLSTAVSQDWKVQYAPLAVALEDFTSVSAVSADTAFIVGSSGVILKTVNGGAGWERQTSGTDYLLQTVSAVDGSTAFAGGTDGNPLGGGMLLRTRDGGKTWEKMETPIPIHSVSAVNRNVAFAVGGIGQVVTTRNGGANWSGGSLRINRKLSSISAVDADVAYAAGDIGTILRTTDGGVNWESQESGSQFMLWSVSAVDRNIAYAVGARDPAFQGGTVLKTTDGGARWFPQAGASDKDLACVSAVDANIAYAVGVGGAIMRTRDGGETWTPQSSGASSTLRGVSALRVGVAFAAGYTASIAKTTFAASIRPLSRNSALAARIAQRRVWFTLEAPGLLTIRMLDPLGRGRFLATGSWRSGVEYSLPLPPSMPGMRWVELKVGDSRRLLPLVGGDEK